MYQTSPMENFNKNNPFIVISKRKYDKIVDDVHTFSKNCIRWSIIIIAIWLIEASIATFFFINNKIDLFHLITIPLLAIYIIITVFVFRRKIKYFMIIHPNMREFDRISSLEVNNILALNNEDVLNCLHGLFELHGELIATTKYYNMIFNMYLAIEIIVGFRFII